MIHPQLEYRCGTVVSNNPHADKAQLSPFRVSPSNEEEQCDIYMQKTLKYTTDATLQETNTPHAKAGAAFSVLASLTLQ